MPRNPNKEDPPYRPAPGPGHPDYTPPPPIKRPTKLAKNTTNITPFDDDNNNAV